MKDDVALKIENVSKQYRLGLTGTGTIGDDLKRWWHKARGKEDPFAMVGDVNDRTVEGGDYIWALKDINLEVKQGEILGIIGKNGAGKSTLLKILSKITGPTTGSIKMRGRMASLLEVGTGFHDELTGRENIFLNGAILGMTKKEISTKLDEIIDFSGCAKYIDTPVKRYSSGMRVRLGFAVAAFLEPDILVVDEVLAVGDAEFQKQAIGKMKDVSAKGGRAVLFVSHNMASVRNLCDRGVVMHQGRIVFQGGIDEAISRYLQENIADTEDAININVPGTARIGTGEAHFTKVYIKNSDDEVVNVLAFREKFKVIMELEVFKKIENVNITISVLSKFSEAIATCISQDEKYKLSTFEKGKYLIEFEVSQSLMPGNFALSFGVHFFHTGSSVDHVEYFYPFEVEKETKNGNFEYPWATVHGYIELKNDWKINKIEN